jgi:hypothetical protein
MVRGLNRANQVGSKLINTPFRELPLGSVTPAGWLRDQLEIQAAGMTGQLGEHWEDVGSNSGWLGGTGESWERGPYYLDGLLPLAYLLNDQNLIKQVQPWVEWTLASQRGDGQFGPTVNEDWWCRMIMIKVLMQYYEATSDERVLPFMSNYFKFQAANLPKNPLKTWGQARGGENILAVLWLYERTGEEHLLELAELIHQQTLDWAEIFTHFPFWRYQTKFDHRIHVVNVAMGIKEPAVYYLLSGDAVHKDAAWRGINSLMTHHGQVHGMFSGDEWLAGTHPSQGVELCAVVEYMFSLANLVRICGSGRYGDILEKVAFNALPATISSDWLGHQYDQQVNQVMCTFAKRNWTMNRDDSNLFGLEPNFGCCTANMHQGWPKFVARLWMATEDAGLAAISYAPCRVQATVGHGAHVVMDVETNYPFREQIHFNIRLSEKASFPIKLRIPGWCKNPLIKINGKKENLTIHDGFAAIQREWKDGDQIELVLPMTVETEQRANYAVGIHRGPLVFALPIGESWQRLKGADPFPDWEIYPTTPWNYGLQIDGDDPNGSFEVRESPIPKQPFLTQEAPVRLAARGRRIPSWGLEMNSAAAPPMGPVELDEPEQPLILVPYASARLRIAEFPTVK